MPEVKKTLDPENKRADGLRRNGGAEVHAKKRVGLDLNALRRPFTLAAEALERNGRLSAALPVIAVAAALLLLLGCFGGFANCAGVGEGATKAGTAPQEAPALAGSAEQGVEARLESILSSLAGVGRVRVMVTLGRGTEGGANGGRSDTAFSFGNGAYPLGSASVGAGSVENAADTGTVRGVIVVAEGAESIGVRLNIIAAVSTVLGVDAARVDVFPMGNG